MEIHLGRTKFEQQQGEKLPVAWNPTRTTNSHMVLVGSSGTGKTHQIRRFIAQIAAQPGIRALVIDSHGDMLVPGESLVKFTERSNFGLNPLKVSPDLEFGGVRKRIRSTIAMINRARTLGSKQEAALINVLGDLYAAAGFYADDPTSWSTTVDSRPDDRRKSRKRQPNIGDLKRFAQHKLEQMMIGNGAKATLKLEELNRAFASLERGHTKTLKGQDINLDKLKNECIGIYSDYINAIETGREIEEIIKYQSRDVMSSVYERILSIESSGIFKPTPPPFDPSAPIWRYEIKTANRLEQRMFVDTLIEEIFLEARQQGPRANADTFIVLDEAHKFLDEEHDHIINIVAREGRKFGLALLLASQSLNHFPEDTLANSACKIILGLDEMYHQVTARKLGIDPKRLTYLQPTRTALVQLRSKGAGSGSRFVDIELNS